MAFAPFYDATLSVIRSWGEKGLRLTISCLLWFAVPLSVTAESGAPPILTVWEALQDIHRYDGQSVVVVGRFSSTDEGSWLDEDCDFKVVNDGREFLPSISLGNVASDFAVPLQKPRHFKWDKQLIDEKLRQVKQTTKLRVARDIRYSDHWVAALGRLETHLPRTIERHTNNGVADTNQTYIEGFGHLSSAPAALIWSNDGLLLIGARSDRYSK